MNSKISVNIFYVSDSCVDSLFKGVYALKLINDKIEEINFNVSKRIEERNDIDMIIKSFDAITVCIIEKEIILRLTNNSIKVIPMRRSRGLNFEMVKGVMVRLSLFDGVDATLYSGTRLIGSESDNIVGEVSLPSFAVAMTREEIDQRFDERRRRREERDSGKFSTPTRSRASISSPSSSQGGKATSAKDQKSSIDS